MRQQLLKMEVALLTLTATSSIATYEDITVTVSTSGTATEGTDYRCNIRYYYFCISNNWNCILYTSDDTFYENSETAIIDIAVSGGGASESGTQQLTLTIT